MCIITTSITVAGITISALAANIIAGTAAAVTVASAALGAVSSYSQGKSQQAMYNYQAQVAQQNAKIANNNAAMERQTGIEEARMQRIKSFATPPESSQSNGGTDQCSDGLKTCFSNAITTGCFGISSTADLRRL